MRKLFYFFALLFTTSTLFIACSSDETDVVHIPVASVMLRPATFSMLLDTLVVDTPTRPLTAIIAPVDATNQNVTWSSSDEDVAEVNADGVVTAVSEGTATITVTTVEGNFRATAAVTVTLTPISVESVTIAGCNAATSLAVDSIRLLTAVITPANATNTTVTWSSSDPDIATVDENGVVTAHAIGTATITVTTADGGETEECEIKVEACHIDNPAGVLINGVRWATRNVDAPGTFADNPEDAGMFYRWNDPTGWSTTNPLRRWYDNEWIAYNWSNASEEGTTWTLENDPCPPGWRLPMQAHLDNLHNQPSTWIQRNGVNGRIFGIAPNQLFLPAVGNRSPTGALSNAGYWGHYWSRQGGSAAWVWILHFRSGVTNVDTGSRNAGFSVRCVEDLR